MRISWLRFTAYCGLVCLSLAGCGGSDSPNHRYQMGGAIQGTALVLADAVSTFAGSAVSGSADGSGNAAAFWYPSGITTDGTWLYVTDSGNNTIRRIQIATGQVDTIAGTAGSAGSTDGAPGTALFNNPQGITTDGAHLYVADAGNNTIRRVSLTTRQVDTIAGTAGSAGSTDGLGTLARFNDPQGITTDGGSLYVTDTGNHTIRRVSLANGDTTTLAGTPGIAGSANGTGAAAGFSSPQGITTDGGSLYVADTGNNTIRRVTIASATVATVAGTAGTSGFVDGVGSFARFNAPYGITTDGRNLFVTDNASTVREIPLFNSKVTTIVGSPGLTGYADGTGVAARFWFPQGLTTDGHAVFVADHVNNMIRKIQ